jgi:hypothetical protein
VKKLLLLFLSVFLLARFAAAIPAFARKYGYSCEVCHAPIPHLKAFGEEFMDNGYRIPDNEPPRATIDTGDPILLLQRELPLAFRFDGFLTHEPNSDVKPDFKSPFVMKILSGGNISNSISYYAYFLFTEEGKIAGLEDTYLAFQNVFGTPVSVIFGQYRVSDPVKPSEIRLTFEEYKIYKFAIGQSQINLSYDRGILASYGTNFGTDIVLQVVNGNGIDTPDIFDKDKYKSFVWRVGQSFSKKNVKIGLLGYHGKEEQGGVTNTVNYFGPDIRVRLPKVDLMLQYVRRSDTNPFFGDIQEKRTTDAYLGEIIFSPWGEKGRWFFTAAYNRVKSAWNEFDYETLTVNASYVLRRNVKWMNEYTHDLAGNHHRWLTGFIVGI